MLQPFDAGFNRITQQVTANLMPMGWDVSENAPNAFDDMVLNWQQTGRIKVFPATVNNSFADAKLYEAFRAWHDLCHIRILGHFTAKEEWKVIAAQHSDLSAFVAPDTTEGRRYARLVSAEIAGLLASAYQHHGQFPEDFEHRKVVARWITAGLGAADVRLTLPPDIAED